MLDKYFYREFCCDCDECDDISIVNCVNCGSTQFNLSKNGKMTCLSCGEQQEGSYTLSCDSGHIRTYLGIKRIVSLIPNSEFIQKTIHSLLDSFNIKMGDDESFYIFNGNVTLLKYDKQGEFVKIEEIKELSPIKAMKLELSERDILLEQYKRIKEKCRVHTNEACNRCDYEKRRCIMSLFIPFDFRPSPHQNSEFGDVNIQVTYEEQKMRFVGIAKSKTGQETLTVSTKEAREMIQQVLTMTHDTRADIIAPICPMRFHPQLLTELEYIAKLTGKKMTILDDEFMVRLLKYNNQLKNSLLK